MGPRARSARSTRPLVALALAGALVACVPPLDRPAPGELGPPPPDLLPPLGDWPKPGGEPGGACGSQSCELGCDELAGRCRRLRAANVDAAAVFAAQVASLTLAGVATIDTDTGEIKEGATTIRAAGGDGSAVGGIYWASVTQGPGGKLALFGVKRLEVKAGATVTILGRQGFVLYATEAATIEGSLLAPAKGPQAGPGGFDGGPKNTANGAACGGGEGKGGGTTVGGSNGDGGGGGGGFKGAGGAGGDSDFSANTFGGGGGAPNGEPTLVPLRGGCGGGAGGGPEEGQGDGGYGGGGGGAIQLSVNGTLTVAGVVSAPGGGGEGAHEGAAGGGGGAGGAILLQALSLELAMTGVLAANGGGGGSGAYGPGQTGASGQSGQPSATAAKGGVGGGAYGGAGGAGGAAAEESGKPGAKEANGGGGGGGVGRIAIVAKTSTLAGVTSPADVSKSQAIESF